MPRIYRRTIEGWDLEGNDSYLLPSPSQSEAWDALTTAEQDRITDKFDCAIFDEVMHDEPMDVLPGERAYEQWKANRQEAMQ